ncbi:MAG: ATP-binding protein [Gallionella sp.]|nr:ATP-binding protein [Gallionella sp.]MDD4958601.1 ATP-binding protein [Gallionella sp.]
MLEISEIDIMKRLQFDNPWWTDHVGIDKRYSEMPRRTYFDPFIAQVIDRSVNRAVVLMGPRRVGKTVMVHHSIDKLLKAGVSGKNILYLSLETPLYTGIALERLLEFFTTAFVHGRDTELFIFFDEVQYLKGWEVHLKSLVDSYVSYRFVVTGSAAAALRLKSNESGAGRFTDFVLPPLTFAEYLRFIDRESELIDGTDSTFSTVRDIAGLNEEFVNYLNYGGYPEAVFSETIRKNTQQYIKSDIIDKVLLRDLPSLYGISDIQELNRLFTTLAYNTGNEVSLEALSIYAGVAKNTINRYLDYLEAAFLIIRVERIDQNAKRFKRAVSFKVYLTNPSMRAALFGQVEADSPEMGQLTETAIFSQWQHSENFTLYYARWKTGEVDIVSLGSETQKPIWAVEVKWSDRPVEDHSQLNNCIEFVRQNPNVRQPIMVTTRTITRDITHREVNFEFHPSSLYAYRLGKNILRAKFNTVV